MTFKHIALIGLMSCWASPQAEAARRERSDQQFAVNNCQAALPSFEGALRKSPLGIRNVGTSTAFISCGLSAESLNSSGVRLVEIAFSGGESVVPVTCTLINGRFAPGRANVLSTKTFLVSGGLATMQWTVNDNGGLPFSLPNISCGIPPGLQLNRTTALSDIEVGA